MNVSFLNQSTLDFDIQNVSSSYNQIVKNIAEIKSRAASSENKAKIEHHLLSFQFFHSKLVDLLCLISADRDAVESGDELPLKTANRSASPAHIKLPAVHERALSHYNGTMSRFDRQLLTANQYKTKPISLRRDILQTYAASLRANAQFTSDCVQQKQYFETILELSNNYLDVEAKIELAELLYRGIGCDKSCENELQALGILKSKAHCKKHTKAKYYLGHLLYYTQYAHNNREEGLKLIAQAAAQGLSAANQTLRFILENRLSSNFHCSLTSAISEQSVDQMQDDLQATDIVIDVNSLLEQTNEPPHIAKRIAASTELSNMHRNTQTQCAVNSVLTHSPSNDLAQVNELSQDALLRSYADFLRLSPQLKTDDIYQNSLLSTLRELATEHNDKNAKMELAIFTLENSVCQVDIDDAVNFLRRASSEGNMWAAYLLGKYQIELDSAPHKVQGLLLVQAAQGKGYPDAPF